jgi:hypothetical protein
MDSSNILNTVTGFFKNFDINNISSFDIIFLIVCLVGVWIVFKILGTIARLVSIVVILLVIFLIFQKTQSGEFANMDILGVVQKDIKIIIDFAKNLIGF